MSSSRRRGSNICNMLQLGYRAIYQSNVINAMKEARKHGFRVLELHCNAPKFSPGNFFKEERMKIKNLAQKYNIILQTHAPLELSLIFTNNHLREAAKLYLKDLLIFSRDIGARCLTLHPGKAAMYYANDGKKMKDDDIYTEYYSKLFEDSIKYIASIAPKDVFVCVENTDNFTLAYMKVLEKYLPPGKIFLTLDIMKCFTYSENRLIENQWGFFKRNKKYVRNIHVSGAMHGAINGWEKKIEKFFYLFKNKDLPVIIEILPIESAIKAKKIIEDFIKCKHGKKLKSSLSAEEK